MLANQFELAKSKKMEKMTVMLVRLCLDFSTFVFTQHTCTSIAAFRFSFPSKVKHIDSYRKRCSQSTFDRFSVGCIISSFCFSVFVSVRNSVLSPPALALQPIIERGKQSWPFASSLVVSFWVGEEC